MSRTASTWQSTELENRNAFTVQLQSLLTQVKSFASYAAKNNNSLSSVQKSKLEELHIVNDSWLEAIGDVQKLKSPLTHAAVLQDTTKATLSLSLSSSSSAIADPSFAISPSPLPEHDNDSSAPESSLISLSQSRCTNDEMSSKQESKNEIHVEERDEAKRGDASLEVSLVNKNKTLELEEQSKEAQNVEKVNEKKENSNDNDKDKKAAVSTEKNTPTDLTSKNDENIMEKEQTQKDSTKSSKEKRETEDIYSNLTVEVEVESVIGDKTLAELVQLLTLLRSNDLPDARKFKALALALTRLLMVRCEIVLKSALRRIVFYTFKFPAVQTEKKQQPWQPEQHEKSKPEERENTDNNSSFTVGRASPFIASARDIRNSCQALSRCVTEMAVNENWSDSMAVRFAVKFAADILQIMRKSILYLEFNLLHIMFAAHKFNDQDKHVAVSQSNINTTESIDTTKQEEEVKRGEEEKSELANDVKMAYKQIIPDMELVQCKVEELKAQWGPFVCNALLQFGPVMDVCINVLVRAAGLVVVSSSSSSSSPTRIITSTDTAGSNTNSNSSTSATPNHNVYNTNTGNGTKIAMEPMEVVKRSSQEELRWLSEEVIRGVHFRYSSQKEEEEKEEEKKENEKISINPHVSKKVQKGNLQLTGLAVLLNLQISWTLEVCVALSHYSGDDSDGKKLTSQLMYSIFVNWSKLLYGNCSNKVSENTPLQENTLRNAPIAQQQQHREEQKEQSMSILLQVNALLQHVHWRKPVLSGLLTCILSSEQAIRFCGLTTLSILTTFAALSHKWLPWHHLHPIGTSDIGYLYKKCLFKLLAPNSNCSQNVKKEVLWHVICNFTSTLVPLPLLQTFSHSQTNEMTHSSMLLYLYKEYDLQISWHELNLIEELVQLLSAIVRQGSRDDFARMQTASAITTNTTNTINNSFMNTGDSNNTKSRQKMKVEKAIMRQLQQELPHEPGSPVFIKSLENIIATTTTTTSSLSSQSTPFLSNTMSVEETWLPNPLLILPLASSMAVLTHTSSEHSLSLSSSSSSSYSMSLSRSKPPFVLQQEWLDSFSLPSLALYGLTSLAEILCTELPRLTIQTNDTSRNKIMLHDVLLEELRNTLHLKLRERKNAEQTRAELFNASPEKAIIRLFHLTNEDLQPEGCDNFVAHRYDHHYLPFTFTENVREDGCHLENELEKQKEETEDLATNLHNTTTKSFTDTAASTSSSTSYASYYENNSSNTSSLHKIRSIVLFFRNVSALSPDAIAEYLTLPSCFPLQVCAAYMASLPLSGKSLPEALRELLTTLPLPREGQRIERLLEYFSAAYYSANAHTTLNPFTPNVYNWDNLSWCTTTHNNDNNNNTSNKKELTHNNEIDRQIFPFTEDTFCFVATVATVMLNTDQHNPHAGAKMNLKSFIAQMKSSINSIYFTNGYAEDIFYHISHHFLGKPRIATENNNSATNNSSNNVNESIKTGEQTSMPVSSSTSTLTSIHKNLAVRGNAQDSYHGINALFISNEERQQLAFAMERQQLMNTTREFIVHQYSTNTILANTSYDTTCTNKIKIEKNSISTNVIANELHGLRHHLSLLRDALLMNWFTLLSVFNVGVQGSMPRKVNQPSLSSPPSTLQNVAYSHYNNNQLQEQENKQESVLLYNIHSETGLPEGVLLPCIRGLQCLFYLAAAFDLPTESSEALVALVRLLSINRSVRVNTKITNKSSNNNLSQKKESNKEEEESSASRITRCVLTAIFSVAASPFMLHLSTYCWNHIFTLLLPFSTPLHNTSSNSFYKSENVQRQSTMRNNKKEEEEERRPPPPEEKFNHGVSHELEMLCTSLFTRIEHVTRESCEARRVMTDDTLYLNETRTSTLNIPETDQDNCTSSVTRGENVEEVKNEEINELRYDAARMASASVHAMLNAMVELLEDESIRHHSTRFAQLLHLLHRILTYTCIKRSTSMNEQCVGVINERSFNTTNNNAMTDLYKSCMNEEVRVVTYVNVKDFYYSLLPQLMALLDRCSVKDENCISAILNCIVELLNIMWNSYTTEFSIVSEEVSVTNRLKNVEEEHEEEKESAIEGGEENVDTVKNAAEDAQKIELGQSKRLLTRDDVPEEVIACFNVFERILAHTNYKVSNNKKINSDNGNSKINVYYTNAENHAELLRRHILQTIKELIVRSLHTFASFAAQWHNMTKCLPQKKNNKNNICKFKVTYEWSIGAKHGLVSLHTLYEIWRRLLNPLMTLITSRDEYQHNEDSYTLSQLTLHQLVLIATGLQGNQNNNNTINNTIIMSNKNIITSNVNALFTLYYSRLLSTADKQRLEANEMYDKAINNNNANSNNETINYKKMMTSTNSNALGKVKRDVCEYCGFIFRHMSYKLITLLLAQVAFAGTLFASCQNNTTITRTMHINENTSNEKRMMKLIDNDANALDVDGAMSCLNELCHLCSATLSQLNVSSYTFANNEEQLQKQDNSNDDVYMEISNTWNKQNTNHVSQKEKKEVEELEKSIVERDVVFALGTSINTQLHTAKYTLQLLFALLLVESNVVRMNVMERIRVLLAKCTHVQLLQFVIRQLSIILISAAKNVNTQLLQRYRHIGSSTKIKNNGSGSTEAAETTLTSASSSSSLMCNCACISTEWNSELMLSLPLSFSLKAEIRSLEFTSSRNFLMSLLSAALRLLSHDMCFIEPQYNYNNKASPSMYTYSSSLSSLHTSSEKVESMSTLISHMQLNTTLFASFIMECGTPLSLILLINKRRVSLINDMKDTKKEVDKGNNTNSNTIREETQEKEEQHSEKEMEVKQLTQESLQMATEVIKKMMQAISEYNKHVNEAMNRFAHFIEEYENNNNNINTYQDEKIREQVHQYSITLATVKDVYRTMIMSSLTAFLWKLRNTLIGNDDAKAINKHNPEETNYDEQMHNYISTLLEQKEEKKNSDIDFTSNEGNVGSDTMRSKETNNHYTLHTKIQELPCDTINTYYTLLNYVSWTMSSVCATMKRVTAELEQYNKLLDIHISETENVNAKRNLSLYKLQPLPVVNDDVILTYLTEHINILLSLYSVYDGDDSNEEKHWHDLHENVVNTQNTTNVNTRKKSGVTEMNVTHVPIKQLCYVYFDLALSDVNAWPVQSVIDMFVKIITATRSLQTRLTGYAERVNSTKEQDIAPQENHFTRILAINSHNSSEALKYMNDVYVDLCAAIEMWIQKSIKLEPISELDNTELLQESNVNVPHDDDGANINDETETISQGTKTSKLYEFQQRLGSSGVFNELITLLTPHAGSVISAIRDYLSWYIDRSEQSHQQKESEHETVVD